MPAWFARLAFLPIFLSLAKLPMSWQPAIDISAFSLT